MPSSASSEPRVDSANTEPSGAPSGTASPAPSSSSSAPTQSSSAPEGTIRVGTHASITLAGYIEAFYSWNFNDPSNGLTNYRGFDNRHNTFSISNVVLDTSWTLLDQISGRLALQVGTTPETYYLAEPDRPGTSVTGPSNFNVWKFIQQANVAWHAPIGHTVLLEAGIFLSPIGPEGMAVKDQWNWSRSNLFFGLPFYHTGLRATYPITNALSVSVGGYNGWNSVVDNNVAKSVSAQVTYLVADHVSFSAMYFGGIERSTGAPEGQPWRHLFDTYITLYPTRWFSFLAHADCGFEPNNFGVSAWAAGALYVRFQPAHWLYLAARGDFFYEWVAQNASGTAASIFWPTPWVSSGTATIDFRPVDNISLRVEYRHDQAPGNMYFSGIVQTSPLTGAFIPNAASQDTLTGGVTSWF